MLEIVNMTILSAGQLEQAARLLHHSLPIGWPAVQDARDELRERLAPENTLLAAVENGEVLGFVGILAPSYDGRVFELHPLAVRKDMRGRGIGRALVAAIEDAARAQGGQTLWLSADDEANGGETSLAGADLFDSLPAKLAAFDPGSHQTAFYQRLAFTVIGVMPDANGPGKPDIYMGKRLQ